MLDPLVQHIRTSQSMFSITKMTTSYGFHHFCFAFFFLSFSVNLSVLFNSTYAPLSSTYLTIRQLHTQFVYYSLTLTYNEIHFPVNVHPHLTLAITCISIQRLGVR